MGQKEFEFFCGDVYSIIVVDAVLDRIQLKSFIMADVYWGVATVNVFNGNTLKMNI